MDCVSAMFPSYGKHKCLVCSADFVSMTNTTYFWLYSSKFLAISVNIGYLFVIVTRTPLVPWILPDYFLH